MNNLDKLDSMIWQLRERIKLQNMLDKLDHYIRQLQKRIESRDTKQNDLSKSQHVNIAPSNVDDSRVVEDVYFSFGITSVVDDTLVDPSTTILNEIQCFF